jgi:hypothetical protein
MKHFIKGMHTLAEILTPNYRDSWMSISFLLPESSVLITEQKHDTDADSDQWISNHHIIITNFTPGVKMK